MRGQPRSHHQWRQRDHAQFHHGLGLASRPQLHLAVSGDCCLHLGDHEVPEAILTAHGQATEAGFQPAPGMERGGPDGGLRRGVPQPISRLYRHAKGPARR
jgi:hypothetical protein